VTDHINWGDIACQDADAFLAFSDGFHHIFDSSLQFF
jgi:hypothetical protein